MELYQQMLADKLARNKLGISREQLRIDASSIIHDDCYQAIKEIKEVLETPAATENGCRIKIARIKRVLKEIDVECEDFLGDEMG